MCFQQRQTEGMNWSWTHATAGTVCSIRLAAVF